MRKFEVTSRHRVFDGFVKVDEAEVSLETKDGQMSKPSKRLVVERGDSAAVLLHDRDTDRLILARQFRFPLVRQGDPWLLEIVAGKIDEGESSDATAKREAEEEVGVTVRSLERIASMYPSPGGLSERIDVYYAQVDRADTQGNAGGVDEGEDVERVELSPQEAFEMLGRGEIRDGKTLVALQWLAAKFNR